MDNRQRNIIIIIALILLYFYFNKKDKTTKVITPETPPEPYSGTCPYMLDEDRKTPTPLVEGNNSNYLVGVDPELKGDFKIYYWCCPIPRGSGSTKLAVLVWEAINDPYAIDPLHGNPTTDPKLIQYLTDRGTGQYQQCFGKCPADISKGDDNIAKAWIRYAQSQKWLDQRKTTKFNYDLAMTNTQLTSLSWHYDKTTMMKRILDAKVKYCQDNPTATVDGKRAMQVPCGTCSEVLNRYDDITWANGTPINDPSRWIDYLCLQEKMIYIKETIEDTQTSTYGQYGSMPIVAETNSVVMGSPLLKKLEEISVNFDFMKDDGTIATYSKIFKIEWSSYSHGGLRAEPDAKIVACDI
tara:strand:- start:243 stop:1304 length:1062 start_codon:yes stop_codon:yes gene_type:complete